jgi:hypothetical protein
VQRQEKLDEVSIMLKGQLHTHTTCSDGNLTPQEAANVYSSLGFDFIAFTDHDHLLKHSYREAIAAVRTELLIFTGVELTVPCSKGYIHVSRIEGNEEVLHIFNHLADYDLAMRETLRCVSEVAERYPLDAVEITHHGFPTPYFDTPAFNYPRLAADDSHDRSGCGRAWIELDCLREKDEIITAIREGRFRNGYAGRSLLLSEERKQAVQLA